MPPTKNPGVLTVFEAYKKKFGLSGRAFRGPYDEDAATIQDCIRQTSIEQCLVVVEYAPLDDWVSGRADDAKAKHESIRYIFGNADAFARILRDGEARDRARRDGSAVSKIEKMKTA